MDKDEMLKSVNVMIKHSEFEMRKCRLLFYIWFRKYDDYAYKEEKLSDKCILFINFFTDSENACVIRRHELLKLKNEILNGKFK